MSRLSCDNWLCRKHRQDQQHSAGLFGPPQRELDPKAVDNTEEQNCAAKRYTTDGNKCLNLAKNFVNFLNCSFKKIVLHEYSFLRDARRGTSRVCPAGSSFRLIVRQARFTSLKYTLPPLLFGSSKDLIDRVLRGDTHIDQCRPYNFLVSISFF